jgi:2-C-methyl-D-erythritol 2,4-cyclodiphosphate synthase
MSPEHRIGIGYDAHRFGTGGTLLLGGIEIPGQPGLEGHSDADVLAHAITDALLGAAGLGDIGRHFPDDDPRYENADSLALLAEAVGLLRANGWRVANVDATVVCESPKLEPYKAGMAQRLGVSLEVPSDRVGVKATTNEGMGFIGRGEGIAVLAVALIDRDAEARGK